MRESGKHLKLVGLRSHPGLHGTQETIVRADSDSMRQITRGGCCPGKVAESSRNSCSGKVSKITKLAGTERSTQRRDISRAELDKLHSVGRYETGSKTSIKGVMQEDPAPRCARTLTMPLPLSHTLRAVEHGAKGQLRYVFTWRSGHYGRSASVCQLIR